MEYDELGSVIGYPRRIILFILCAAKTFSLPRKIDTTTTTAADIKYSGKQLSMGS